MRGRGDSARVEVHGKGAVPGVDRDRSSSKVALPLEVPPNQYWS